MKWKQEWTLIKSFKRTFLKGFNIALLPIFLMNKTLSLVIALSFTTVPVQAWGEGGCSLSNKNKASQNETVEQVDSSDSAGRLFQENE